ncbi:hypothetical protein MBLNU230_g6305t1 [Neophaeotheca triangularis]
MDDTRSPSIAAIGVIGRNNNPLHIALFPIYATNPAGNTTRDDLEFQFMLNSSLDIFEARLASKPVGQDFGLLHALDERMALYGWCTNTGVKLVIVVDMEGRPIESASGAKGTAAVGAMLGLRNSDLTPAFQALQQAYINLLRNPFYVPDDHDPRKCQDKGASLEIKSPRFEKEVRRIGEAWYPGISTV